MRLSHSTSIAIIGALLFGIVTLSSALPGQKKKPQKGGASPALIAEGKKVYAAQGCAACHLIGDKGGKTGPDLTKVGKTAKVDRLTQAIRDPKKLDPKNIMPAYGPDKIDAKQFKGLIAYMLSLK